MVGRKLSVCPQHFRSSLQQMDSLTNESLSIGWHPVPQRQMVHMQRQEVLIRFLHISTPDGHKNLGPNLDEDSGPLGVHSYNVTKGIWVRIFPQYNLGRFTVGFQLCLRWSCNKKFVAFFRQENWNVKSTKNCKAYDDSIPRQTHTQNLFGNLSLQCKMTCVPNSKESTPPKQIPILLEPLSLTFRCAKCYLWPSPCTTK